MSFIDKMSLTNGTSFIDKMPLIDETLLTGKKLLNNQMSLAYEISLIQL
jgi:hypothetical protein